MGKIRALLAAALLFLPGVASAAEDQEIFLSTLLTRGPERRILAADSRNPGHLLAAATGVDNLPVSCGTPLAWFLTRADPQLPLYLREVGALIGARPSLDSERSSPTQDGRFVIHYPGLPSSSGLLSADRDRNGLPDLVDRVAEALQAARSSLVARLGYPAPAPEGERLDLYLAEIGHGVEGFVVSPADGGSPFLVLDAGLTADRVMPATLHQVAHLSLAALAPRAPQYWSEASASFLTILITGDWKGHDAALRARLQNPGRGLASDGLLLMQGTLLWPEFLAESSGDPGIVRLIWEEMGNQGVDPLAATDAVLRRATGRTFLDAVREYAAWNLFTGDRDDGQHYISGHALPASALTPASPDAPLRLEPSETVEPLGSAAFRLQGDGRRGTIDFELSAEGGRPGADLLVFYRPWGPQPVLAPVVFDPNGNALLSVPWADAREAWIILRNDAMPGGGSARFEASVLSDPYAPYDLASLTASEAGRSILLEWTTASEKGLQAWNVYRSETPGGPFTRLNSVAVPAAGETVAETGYIFVDDIARPGRRYYYLLEGLTALGLPQRSHIVSGRIGPAR